jgi:hypothetical protein
MSAVSMRVLRCIDAIRVVAAVMMLALGSMPAMAQSVAGTAQARAHVYLLRGLMNIFSLGMDGLAEELSKRGVYATVSNYSESSPLRTPKDAMRPNAVHPADLPD